MTKIKCTKCGDILEGDYRGTFKECKCHSCYIDETEYYYRIGGNEGDWKLIEVDTKYLEKLKEKKEKKENDKKRRKSS